MSLNTKIFISFAIMAVMAVAIALIGWSGVRASNNALKAVLEMDLPAEKRLGLIGRHFEAMRSEKNYLLNPNLSPDERRSRREAFAFSRDSLVDDMAQFDAHVKNASLVIEPAQNLKTAWNECDQVMQNWLTGNDEIFNQYQAWEDTTILNPTLLWGSLQQYRGDHYFLVRRISEMIAKNQVLGSEVRPDDNLCAFGKWRESFDAGRRPLWPTPFSFRPWTTCVTRTASFTPPPTGFTSW